MDFPPELTSFVHQVAIKALKPTTKTHWIYMLSALFIAVAVYYWRRAEQPGVSLRQFLFPKSVWLHRSARTDYLFVLITMPLWSVLAAPHLISSVSVGSDTVWAFTHWIREWQSTSRPNLAVAIAYTVAVVVATDLSVYAGHRLLHRFPLLWEFHKVHHSAEVLTPVTIYRVHPVEHLIMAVSGALIIGVVTGIFLYLFPHKLTPVMVFGVNAGRFAFYLVGVNLRHSHIWLSFGPKIERYFLSPAQHQIHHSNDPRHFDRNFGSELAIWDRLFGSLYLTSSRREVLTFGLGEQENSKLTTPLQLYISPFVAAARMIRDKPQLVIPAFLRSTIP